MPPLVSVVIPCHAQARFLAETIESVRRQTFPAHETLVIDDASPDNVEEIAASHDVILHRLPERLGVGPARNVGLERCRGEYLVFVDADDRLLPKALAEGVAALSSRPRCALVWGGRRLIDAEGRLLPAKPKQARGSASYVDLLRENLIGPPVGVMFRRAALEAAGGFAAGPQGAEDYDSYLRLTREHPAYGHGHLIAEYRIHDGNMSANQAQMVLALLSVLDRQAPSIGRDRELRRAAAAGRRWVRESYDADRRLNLLSEYTRTKRWGKAVLGSVELLLRYPRIFFPILLRRTTRALLPRS